LILDTNALSAVADGDKGAEAVLRNANQVAIPVIVLGEYRYGIQQSRNRRQYEAWLSHLLPDCRVLAVDDDTASVYAHVRTELKRAGRPIPTNDLWIASLVKQHSMALMSRDLHFGAVPGLRRISW